MKKLIVRVRLADLWNVEYARYVIRILNIVQSGDPNALKVAKRYARLNGFRVKFEGSLAQSKGSTLSITLSSLDNSRDNAFTIIATVSSSFAKAADTALSQAGATVSALVNKHGTDIPHANYAAETQRMQAFCNEAEATPEVMAAFEKMALLPVFTKMKADNLQFEEVFNQRNKELSALENVDMRALRAESGEALTDLLDGIESTAKEGEVDCSALIAEINTLSEYMHSQLKARATRRKAGEKVEEEKPIAVES